MPSPLRCPRCGAELIGPSASNDAGYRCGGCGGRAVTLAGLRPRHPPATLRALWHATSLARELACPACRTPMLTVTPHLAEVSLEVEVCKRCQLVWFDAGELERLPALERAAPKVRPSWPSDGSPALPVASRLFPPRTPVPLLDLDDLGEIAIDLAIDLAIEILD